jgi:hypothetical protein
MSSNEDRDYWDLECPKCEKTGRAQINTPEGPYAVLAGRDQPYVANCPNGFTNTRTLKDKIVFTCNDCNVKAKVKT